MHRETTSHARRTAAATSFRAAACAFALLVAASAPALAQTVPSGGQAAAPVEGQAAAGIIRGQVVDATTGKPLAAATVSLMEKGRRALTDDEGRFALRAPAGSTAVGVEYLGFRDASMVVTVNGNQDLGVIRLDPDPILLSAIVATVDRWEDRRRGFGRRTEVLSQEQINRGYAPNVEHLVRSRMGLVSYACGRGTQRALSSTSSGCVLNRGTAGGVTVVIDEQVAMGGLQDLAAYQPHEIYRIESYGRTRIHIYTTNFVNWAARNNYTPQVLPVFATN